MKFSLPVELRCKNGSAVIVLLALLSLMVLFVFANLKTLNYLSRELKLVERRQIERVQKSSVTNAPAALQPVGSRGMAAAPLPDAEQHARN